ncbi:MAG: PilZ domain-containing protein [Gammaproteobacteria bacterium]|nr:PilZ domain-containing protein [Gammaproteobacteria bacterium]
MEHRWNRRQIVVGDVALSYREQVFGGCKVRNLSPGGMLLEMPRGFLPHGVLVDVVYHSPAGMQQQLRAQVIHKTGRYLGLMFLDEASAADFVDNIKADGECGQLVMRMQVA